MEIVDYRREALNGLCSRARIKTNSTPSNHPHRIVVGGLLLTIYCAFVVVWRLGWEVGLLVAVPGAGSLLWELGRQSRRATAKVLGLVLLIAYAVGSIGVSFLIFGMANIFAYGERDSSPLWITLLISVLLFAVPFMGFRLAIPQYQNVAKALVATVEGQSSAVATHVMTLILWPLLLSVLLVGAFLSLIPPVIPAAAPAPTPTPSPELIYSWKGGGRISSLAFSPDGELLASASGDSTTVTLWSSADRAIVRTLSGHTNGVQGIAFSPDGSLLASASWDRTARLWRVADGTQITVFPHSDLVTSVAFSPDRLTLLTGSEDRTVRLWQISDSQLLLSLPALDGPIGSIFSPDGRYLTWGAENPILRLRSADGIEERALSGHGGAITSVAFSTDATLLASGSRDTSVRLWSLTDGTPQGTLFGHGQMITRLAFSPDGSLLASGSLDTPIRVWQVSDRSLRHNFYHLGYVGGLVFSPDGTILASGAGDQSIRLWAVR